MKSKKIKNLAFAAVSALVLSSAVALHAGQAKASRKTAPASLGQTLWDEWYTVTIGKKIHYGYYNEKVELRNGQIFLQNDYWKHDEDYINRENLGEVAENTGQLTPVFFNFHSVYRTTETTIDASIKDNKFLVAHAKQNGQDRPVAQRTLPSKVFLSSMFSVWLGKKLPTMTEGKTVGFETILEDDLDQGFSLTEGQAKLLKPDDYAQSSGTKKLQIDSRGIRSFWWVRDSGVAERIEMPDQNTVVERVSRAQAKKFLDGA